MSANNQNRITIQLDLNGYSFKIQGRDGSVIREERKSCPMDLAAEELVSELKAVSGTFSVYVSTWKYVLMPLEHFDRSVYRASLSEVRDISDDDMVQTLDLPSKKAVLIFAVSKSIYKTLSGLSKNVRIYPLSYLMIDRLSTIADYNRLIVAFSESVIHIVAAEKDKLLFVNSFPADDIATAEYFILSVAKEVLFNPEHTYIYLYGNAGAFMERELGKYFAGIKYLQ